MFSMDSLQVIGALALFAALSGVFVLLRRKYHVSFAVRTAAALVAGALFGVLLQALFGAETNAGAGAEVKKWINIVAQLFIKSLQLIIVPLVFVSIVNAAGKFGSSREGLAKAAHITGFLLLTTAASALIAIVTVRLFRLSAHNLTGYSEAAQNAPDVAGTILNLVPNNMIAAFTSNAVLPVVFIAALTGWAFIGVRKTAPEAGARFEAILDTAYAFVMKITHCVINFTPYGILSIIAVRAASGSGAFIAQLALIIAAAFTALAAVFALHLAIAFAGGVPPLTYLRKTGPALLFAFSSRSSAATIPLTVEAQRRLGVREGNANLAASLGTCVGQNGCAGVYPAMLALLAGMVQGWDVWQAAFLAPLVLYVVIASIGTAGVGGGATNVSLLVLSLLGLPVELVAILISVDFIIDMGRTLVNVSDSILAGYISGKLEHDIDTEALAAKEAAEQTV